VSAATSALQIQAIHFIMIHIHQETQKKHAKKYSTCMLLAFQIV